MCVCLLSSSFFRPAEFLEGLFVGLVAPGVRFF